MRLTLSIILCFFSSITFAQTLEQNGNTLSLKNGNETYTISEHSLDGNAFLYQNKVYFLDADKSKITVYDIATQKTKDIIALGMKTDKGYEIKDQILNVHIYSPAGKLFFTTRYEYSGEPVYMVWQYDVTSNNYSVFSDGKIDHINNDGTLEVIFYGLDPMGKYSQKSTYYYKNRKPIKVGDKEYQ